MSEQGDKARKALHDMRWGPHIDDPVERQEIMDDAIKIALGTVAALEADNAALRKRVEGLNATLSMFEGFSVSELLRVIAKDYDRSDVGSSVKMRRAMWLKDLADKVDDLAVEETDE